MPTKRPTKKASAKKAGATVASEIPDWYRDAVLQAQRDTEKALADDPKRSAADPTLPIFKVVAEFDLLVEKARFEAGDKAALLGAIRICANHDLVMPEWLARGFIRGYDKALRHEVGSWDDAFGRPFPKGKHLNAARKKRSKAPALWMKVRKMHEAGRAIDDGLFEEVGEEFGLGKTQASEFYYHVDSRMRVGPVPAARVLLDSLKIPENTEILRKERKRR